jgi:hypothetical protein
MPSTNGRGLLSWKPSAANSKEMLQINAPAPMAKTPPIRPVCHFRCPAARQREKRRGHRVPQQALHMASQILDKARRNWPETAGLR